MIPRDGKVEVPQPEMKVLFFLQADCVQEIEGAGTFPVKAGDILVLPKLCRQIYGLGPGNRSPHVHAVKIVFQPGVLEKVGKKGSGDPEADLAAFVQHHFIETRYLPDAQDAPMQEILRGIRREAEQHRPGIRHRVHALCTNLVVHVARRLHDVPMVTQPGAVGHGHVVNQVKEFLLRNFARELTLGEIAWHVKKSEEHLARVFRKVTGQTVFDYLRTVRLETAKTLLIDSDKTLTEIARLTGFSSLALFSHNFSQYVGRSPSAYRQERAQGTQWEGRK